MSFGEGLESPERNDEARSVTLSRLSARRNGKEILISREYSHRENGNW